MELQVAFGCWGRVFAVPSAVVDHFIKLASETQLKVLLYLLRYPEKSFQTEQIAAFLRISEEQAEEAVQFWIQGNILQSASDMPETVQNPAFMQLPVAAAKQTATPSPAAQVQRSSRDIKLDPSEIAAELERSPSLKDLFTCAETTLGRILNHMEQRSLLWMNSYLHLNSTVLLPLLHYCVSIDKSSIAYAEAIAIRWAQEDITTPERAEAEIRRMSEAHTFSGAIQRSFHMNRKPTRNQQEIIEKWQTARYPLNLICLAYEITIEQIDKLDFKYIDKILQNWSAQGVQTPEQAKQLREAGTRGKSPEKKWIKNVSEQERQQMDAYLSTVNRFRKD